MRASTPVKHDYDLWRKTIEVLIAQRRIWVATDQGQLVFVIEISTRCSQGTQIGSTYVPSMHGQVFSTRESRHRQPPIARYVIVSLLVNEGNTATVFMKEWAFSMVLSINSSDSTI